MLIHRTLFFFLVGYARVEGQIELVGTMQFLTMDNFYLSVSQCHSKFRNGTVVKVPNIGSFDSKVFEEAEIWSERKKK